VIVVVYYGEVSWRAFKLAFFAPRKPIENCKQEVQAAQIFIQKQQRLWHFTSRLQISIFFSTMLGCFQNPSSLLFRQVCIVSYWSSKFLKLSEKFAICTGFPQISRPLFYMN
jgi:hypothetical protein